ncbi:MAG: hypothetical protein MUF42_02450 [Cytophagaceae bacterium]|jgi:hypothetical protein|nr:hypothetical protein [Cytophagaceae bacterium]
MLAPVALFAYNRPDYLSDTLKALRANELASETDLYIFCDGPKPNAMVTELNAIDAVKKMAHSATGFKTLTVQPSTFNKGLAASIVQGVTELIEKHEKVIVLEDDIVTSPYFLDYMNTSLDLYENKNNVISIHGYCYPASFGSGIPETFFLKGADCWGWATWKRGWKLFNPDANALIDEIKTQNLINEFNFNNSYPYFEMLEETAIRNHSWAIKWYASAFLSNKLTLYPKHSLVVNIGATGTNSNEQTMKRFGLKLYNKRIQYFESSLSENTLAKRKIQEYLIHEQRGGTGILNNISSKWSSLKKYLNF